MNLERDADMLQDFSKFTNIIPIISKGDHITADAVPHFKQEIRRIASQNSIEFFNSFLVKFFFKKRP